MIFDNLYALDVKQEHRNIKINDTWEISMSNMRGTAHFIP